MEGLGNMSHIINVQGRSQCAHRHENKNLSRCRKLINVRQAHG